MFWRIFKFMDFYVAHFLNHQKSTYCNLLQMIRIVDSKFRKCNVAEVGNFWRDLWHKHGLNTKPREAEKEIYRHLFKFQTAGFDHTPLSWHSSLN